MADRRGTTRARVAAPFLLGLLALGLGACSATPSVTASPAPTIQPIVTPTPAPTVTQAPATEVATPEPTSIAAAPACAATDLKASHDLVEGAAGSRLTTVLLVAARTCSVDAFPAMGLRDAHGAELVGSAAGGSGRVDLDPNVSYSSAVRLANWCNPDPAFPLALVVRLGTSEVGVTGSSFPDQGDMPPCNGGGGPVLEAGAWQATP